MGPLALMRTPGDVDCKTCGNYRTRNCNECIHNEDFDDYYFPANEETLKEREEAARKQLEDEMADERIQVDLPDGFLRAFSAARKFTTHDYLRKEFMLVRAEEKNHLSACNGHVLAFLNCEVPPEIQGRNIVRVEGNTVLIHNGKVPWLGKTENALVNVDKVVTLQDLPEGAVKFVDDPCKEFRRVELYLPGATIAINQKYYQLVMETLTGNIKLYYKDSKGAVLFVGDNGRIVVMPLRTGSDW